MNRFDPRRMLYFFCNYCRPHQRGPVKRIFSTGVLAVVGLGLLASLSTSSNTSRLYLTVDQQTVVVGESFLIDVMVDAHTAVNAVDVVLQYNDQRLQVDAQRQGESVLTIWTEPPSAVGDRITISGGTFRRGFIGDHRILRISAQATEAGVIRIQPEDVTLLAGDGSGDTVAVAGSSLDPIRIYAVTPDAAEAAQATDRPPLLTDLSGDGRVTMQDISIFMAAWNNRSPIYDFTGDGRMTFRDFSVLLADFFLRR